MRLDLWFNVYSGQKIIGDALCCSEDQGLAVSEAQTRLDATSFAAHVLVYRCHDNVCEGLVLKFGELSISN